MPIVPLQIESISIFEGRKIAELLVWNKYENDIQVVIFGVLMPNFTVDANEKEHFLLEQTRIGLDLLPNGYNLGLVVDVGAHIGVFSLNAVLYGAKKVIAIEPHPNNYVRLVNNIIRNNLWGKIIPLPLAIGGKANEPFDMLPLASIGMNSGQRSLKFIGPGEEVVNVPIVPLRWLISDLKIDYLKIDVEGGEFAIFEGEPNEILDNVGFIDIEMHSLKNKDFFGDTEHPMEKRLIPWLEQCGFHNLDITPANEVNPLGDFRGIKAGSKTYEKYAD
jgi:FkbM family methyltransferase